MAELVHPSVPMLEVRDLPATVAFYCERLGFARESSWGQDPAVPTWVYLRRGECALMFVQMVEHDHGDGEPHSHEPALSGAIYCYPDDVDGLADSLRGRVEFEWEPQTMIYGRREFALRDPDGYLLIFGAEAG